MVWVSHIFRGRINASTVTTAMRTKLKQEFVRTVSYPAHGLTVGTAFVLILTPAKNKAPSSSYTHILQSLRQRLYAIWIRTDVDVDFGVYESTGGKTVLYFL